MAKGIASTAVIFIGRPPERSGGGGVGEQPVGLEDLRAPASRAESSSRTPRQREVEVARVGTSRKTTPARGAARTDAGTRATPRPAATSASSTAVPGASCSRRGVKPAARQLRSTASLTAESAVGVQHERPRCAGRPPPSTGSATSRWSAGDGQHEGLHGDGPHVEPVARDRRSQHPEVEAAVAQPGDLGGVSRSAWISSATPGSSCLTMRAIRGSWVNAAVPVNAIRTRPWWPSAMRRTPRTLSSTASRMRRASAWRNSPAGVRLT